MQGTITLERQGWWLCEEDSAGTMYFVHHTSIPAGINLHTNDRIEFDVAPNPLKPGYVHAVNVVRIYRAPRGPRQAVNHGR
jgi:hypothetical protein